MYLLDTNHCSGIIKQDPKVIDKQRALESVPVVTCSIVAGELTFMAERSEFKEKNRIIINHFLNGITVLGIDRDTSHIYGRLKQAIIHQFGPKEKGKRHKVKIEALGVRENDLWIACVAIQYGLTLVSADSDFVRIAQVESLRFESWLVGIE